MNTRLYDDGSSPTRQQIIQGVVDHEGQCIKFIRCCIENDRGGDPCPLYTSTHGCGGGFNATKRLRLARRWLMEKGGT